MTRKSHLISPFYPLNKDLYTQQTFQHKGFKILILETHHYSHNSSFMWTNNPTKSKTSRPFSTSCIHLNNTLIIFEEIILKMISCTKIETLLWNRTELRNVIFNHTEDDLTPQIAQAVIETLFNSLLFNLWNSNQISKQWSFFKSEDYTLRKRLIQILFAREQQNIACKTISSLCRQRAH